MTDHELDLFEPDSLLPGQVPRTGRAWCPEERLLVAVLEDALRCIQRGGSTPAEGRISRRQYLALEAEWWFLSKSRLPFSFLWIADTLGYEPQRIALKATSGLACRVRRSKPGGYGNRAITRLQRGSEGGL